VLAPLRFQGVLQLLRRRIAGPQQSQNAASVYEAIALRGWFQVVGDGRSGLAGDLLFQKFLPFRAQPAQCSFWRRRALIASTMRASSSSAEKGLFR